MTPTFLLLIGLGGCTKDPVDTGKPAVGTDPDDTVDSGGTDDTDDTGETGETGGGLEELVLTLDAPDAEPGDPLGMSAQVLRDGAPVAATITYEVSPETASIAGDGSSVTATADGTYTVTARAGELQDVETFQVDSNGPLLTLSSPRASWVALGAGSAEFTATDNVHNVGTAQVDGASATPSGATYTGAYTIPEEGIALVSIGAVDTDPAQGPNTSDLSYALVAGTTSALDSALEGSTQVRAQQAILDAMAATIEATFDAASVESVILATNPLSETSFACVEASVEGTSLGWDAVSLTLTPSAAGLQLQLDVTSFELEFDTVVDDCYGDIAEYPGTITASTIHVVSDLSFAVPTLGDVEVTMAEPDVSWTDLVIDDGSAYYVLATLGIDSAAAFTTDLFNVVYEDLPAALTDAAAGALEAALEQVTIDQALDVLGVDITLQALVSAIETDDLGLTLQLDSSMSNSGSHPGIPANPGSLLLTGGPPDYTTMAEDVGMSLALDDLNRLLHLAWDGGAFHQSITGLDDSLVISLLATTFPGLESVDVTLTPNLPPVLTPGGTESPLILTIGEMQLDLEGTVSGTYTHLATGQAYIVANVDMSVVDGELSLLPGEPDVLVDIPSTNPDGVAADEQLEEVMAVVAGSLVGDLLPSFEFAIPALPGFGFSPSVLQSAGDADTWILVSGSATE